VAPVGGAQESVGGVVGDDVPSSLPSSRPGVSKYATGRLGMCTRHNYATRHYARLCVRWPRVLAELLAVCSAVCAVRGSLPPMRRSRRGRKGGGRLVSQGMRADIDPLTAGRGLKISTESGTMETANMKIY
jgi:hypothetical protein